MNTSWDTHVNNFPRLRDGLCPTLDQVYPTLLDDLERLGLLEETLVLLTTTGPSRIKIRLPMLPVVQSWHEQIRRLRQR